MTPATTLDVGVGADTGSGPNSVVLDVGVIVHGSGERPPLFVRADEIGFWTQKWQRGEAESARERAAGRLRTFDTGEALLDWLDAPED
ncbi:MAG TPA: hypothetical protein VMT10_12485 [Solirubrobacteraceae bacterium]|nr:hypothetical protein [Solirubrobacteraceae bacterium]